MYKIVLIRHGESTWNLENRFTGLTAQALNPNGHSPAISSANRRKAASSSVCPA